MGSSLKLKYFVVECLCKVDEIVQLSALYVIIHNQFNQEKCKSIRKICVLHGQTIIEKENKTEKKIMNCSKNCHGVIGVPWPPEKVEAIGYSTLGVIP